ncbi:hypothetical protein [Mesonia sp. K7]|uniref:hypothetical protein n=1 Tax=Mesonia sp. K7 TaxID=2218606 RepID=UPI000DA6F8F7|nr:hypothetical protein [Mesonia sp. K7]PZD77779.1 hypothetical protein DNG35_08050 [Mesonia sp. K7]
MIKKFALVVLLLVSANILAQENNTSPYSFFGLGLNKANNTVENRSMGGLGVLADSIHLNFQNPASYGSLRLTTFTLGATNTQKTVEDTNAKQNTGSTKFDYLALAFPTGKLGFGLGMMPRSTVGYEQKIETETTRQTFAGEGGLNKIFLAAGYQIKENLRIGVEGGYNFGRIDNKNLFFESDIQYGTQEKNSSEIRGFSVNFGLQYQKLLNSGLEVTSSITYAPETKLKVENQRELATVAALSGSSELEIQTLNIVVAETELSLPSHFTIGGGLGKPREWFAGLEYGRKSEADVNNTTFNFNNVTYEAASSYRLGGYFIPNYNDITSYFKRVTYRAGFRYEETGLNINNTGINEFGISFGVGLPAGDFFSNFNLGVEYGQRGTTENNLVKENFYNISLSLSFNDKWFVKRKYN